MINDIVIDRVLGALENRQRQFVDDDDILQELAFLGIVECEVVWTPAGDMQVTAVTKFNAPPSRHFLQPYRALRDIDKKMDTMRTDDGLHYAATLLNSARFLSKRLLEMEQV